MSQTQADDTDPQLPKEYMAFHMGGGEVMAVRKSSVQFFRRKGDVIVFMVLGKIFQVRFKSKEESKLAMLDIAGSSTMYAATSVERVAPATLADAVAPERLLS